MYYVTSLRVINFIACMYVRIQGSQPSSSAIFTYKSFWTRAVKRCNSIDANAAIFTRRRPTFIPVGLTLYSCIAIYTIAGISTEIFKAKYIRYCCTISKSYMSNKLTHISYIIYVNHHAMNLLPWYYVVSVMKHIIIILF